MPSLPVSSTAAGSPAMNSFLHAIEARAWVLALNQTGEPGRATQAWEATMGEFASSAGEWPLAQWPLRLWTRLLAQRAMLARASDVAPLAALPPDQRAALLLRLVAGLDIEHAAAVLQVDAPAYESVLRRALAQPGMDETGIEALREALHEQIHSIPDAQRSRLARLREAALAPAPRPEALVNLPALRSRRWLIGLLGVLLLALLLSSIAPPWRSSLTPGQVEALAPEPVAVAPALDDAVVVTHPDYAQLAATGDDALAQQLAFLSWLAGGLPSGTAIGAAPQSAVPPEAKSALPPQDSLLASARVAWPALDAATRSALLQNAADWRSRSAAQRVGLRERMRRWNQLPAPERARLRTPFQAWQRLAEDEHDRIRQASAYLQGLPQTGKQDLHAQFETLPADTQRLWWIGPALGPELVAINGLFAFLPEAERPALLALLRGLDADARRDLAQLAPRMDETRRQALRRELIAAPAAERAALIRRQLGQ